MSGDHDWIELHRGEAPLIVSMPHTGVDIPPEIEARLVSGWLGRKDADWWVDKLYDFAADLGATVIRTRISRTVIDANRDPSGKSLYPGQATTELCPSTSFDGEPLYKPGQAPAEQEIAERRARWFDPYHAVITEEIARLRRSHGAVVLYDAHSIRSFVPRLFDGALPGFNIGTNSGLACAASVTAAVEAVCGSTDFSMVTNGRFKGGYTTRHHGRPETGVHALQMELACRDYMVEPPEVGPGLWPTPYDPVLAHPMRTALAGVLEACLETARQLAKT